MGKVDFKGIDIHFSEKGAGRALVLLHGFLENRTMWDSLTGTLSKRFRVVAIDLPGHGQTPCLGYVHTMEEMADAVKAVLDHLGLRRYVMVGHSMGGYVTLAFAERYPDHLKGFTLFFSTARADSNEKRIDRDRAIDAVKHNHHRFIRQAIPNLFRPRSRDTFRKEVNHAKAEALKTPLQGVVAALEGMKIRPDREVLLHFGPCPVQMICGERDPVLPFKMIEPQTRGKKVTHLLVTENGHMGHIEDTEECTQALFEFADSL